MSTARTRWLIALAVAAILGIAGVAALSRHI